MKNQSKYTKGLKLACLSAASCLFYSCSVAHSPSSAPSVSVPSAPASEAVAGNASRTNSAPRSAYNKRVAQHRPGIATGWGDEIKSNMNYSSFKRSNSTPSSIGSIYYNDKEGIKAMTGNWSYAGKGMQKAANGMVEWGVKSGWGYLKNVHSGGKRFVVGTKGRNYSLVIRNIAHSELELVISVDGLDVLDGKPASVKKRGYIIPAGKTLEIKGFRKSEDAVAAFKFSSVRDSYTNLSNQGTRNAGVIGMAVYTQKGISPWRYGTTEVNSRRGARAFAEAPAVRAR